MLGAGVFFADGLDALLTAWQLPEYSHGPLIPVLSALLFLRQLASRSIFSATSVDQLPHMVAAQQVFGHRLLVPVPDIDRTDYFLVFGANPVVSNGSLMTAPGFSRRLKELRQRGASVVVIDPSRNETAAATTASSSWSALPATSGT